MKYINGWTNQNGTISLLYKENNQKKIKTIFYPWYFYVNNDDKTINFLFSIFEDRFDYFVSKSNKNKNYLKITYPFTKRFYILDRLNHFNIQTYEADLSPLDLYILDSQDFEIEDDYRILYFDIEIDDTSGKIEIGKDRILSLAYYDNTGKFDCLIDNKEKNLLIKILELFNIYDVIIGWNSSNFDLLYLQERFKKYKLEFDWNTVIHIDLMKRFMKICQYKFNVEDFKLSTISQYFLGETKLERTQKIIDLYNTDIEKFKKYNLKDSELLYKLDKSTNSIEIMKLECKWCNTFLREFYVSKLLDMYILKYARKKNIHFKTKIKNNISTSYKGGLVLEPQRGLFKNVYVLDFKSLYPSIIKTFNISIDKLLDSKNDNSIKTINNIYFDKSQGLISEIITNYLKEREIYKNEMKKYEYKSKEYEKYRLIQDAIKELANSMYGILGDSQSRYFNQNIAEAITLTGQYLINKAIEFFKMAGLEIIYGDTDSVFIYDKNDNVNIKETLEIFHIWLEDILKKEFNINKSYILLQYNKKLSKVFFVSKKKYAMRIIEIDDKPADSIEYVGLECIKSDTVNYAKKLQKELINLILTTDNDKEFYKNYILEKRKEFFKNDIDITDIIIRQQIIKHPEEYKGDLAHVKIAKDIINKKEEFYIGMTIEYFIITSKPKLIPERIYNYNGTFDRIYYWNNRIYPLLERILTSVFDFKENFYIKSYSDLNQIELFQ
ncbi:MAG: hypothetical protein NC833_03095 [Candidatus Omnitrophica bacterium]|nr:hypothetical protein [Candidatus Omnitrophota bacterium]